VTLSYSYSSLKITPSEFKCSRDEFLEALKAENIDCAVHYPTPLTKQPAITDLMEPEECPTAEELSKNIFSIPMHPELTEEKLDNIGKGLEKITAHYSK
jgi:dTDP-4-amino-4,6-dideoxygalactose transaminase